MIHPTSTPLPEPTFRPPSRKKRRNVFTAAFTLVELLAVIAVMVMLLALTMPLMRGGNNMEKSAWQIGGMIEQARAYAQSQNTYVWVGLNAATVSDSDAPDVQRIGAFAVASKTGMKTDKTVVGNLVQIDRMQVLENIVPADASASNDGFKDRYPNRYPGQANNDVPENADSIVPTDFNQVMTLPASVKYAKTTGGTATNVVPSTKNLVLEISPDGSVQVAGLAGSNLIELGLQSARGKTANIDDSAIIQISSLTGRVRVIRAGF